MGSVVISQSSKVRVELQDAILDSLCLMCDRYLRQI